MQEEEEIEIKILPVPKKNGVIYGSYKFTWQQRYLNLAPSAMRHAANLFYESRAVESHLINNPWLFLSTSAPVLYVFEDDFNNNKFVSVNGYYTCELYMITKMALEDKLDRINKKQLDPRVLNLWDKAHWRWQTETYGVGILDQNTGKVVFKGSPVSNGGVIMNELTMILNPDREENQNLDAKQFDSRQNLITTMVNSLIKTYMDWITATEFYLSKLATIIDLHTNKGHLKFSGDWKALEEFADSVVGSSHYFKDVRGNLNRYTFGSLQYSDYFISKENEKTNHAHRCATLLKHRELAELQMNHGDILAYDQVRSKKFNDYVDKIMYEVRLAKDRETAQNQKQTDSKTTTETTPLNETPRERLSPVAEVAQEELPEQLEVRVVGPQLDPREQVTGSEKFVDQIDHEKFSGV